MREPLLLLLGECAGLVRCAGRVARVLIGRSGVDDFLALEVDGQIVAIDLEGEVLGVAVAAQRGRAVGAVIGL